MSEQEKTHLPSDVAEEFFAKKQEMQKEKEEKERMSAEKMQKLAASLEKHIEEKAEQDPPSE